MILIEDTRNVVTKHKIKNAYFKSQGIKVVRTKLFCGDYSRLDCQTVCVDSKKDIIEVAANICGSQHERFRNECIRAKENGIKLIILIEENFTLETLKMWQSPKNKKGKLLTQVKGETLSKAMATMQEKYGCEFRFTTKENSGKIIIEILSGINTV